MKSSKSIYNLQFSIYNLSMSQAGETFFTSIGCMDGRALRPVRKFGKAKFGVWYVDTVTEAGLVGKISNNPSQEFLQDLKSKILISVEKHHSKGIIVHGHEECAGNSVDEETHKKDILRSVEVIKSLINSSIPIIAAYVKRKDGDWIVEEVPTTQLA